MLDFARSNTISTQTSNIYLNQLQRYCQFAEVYMLLAVLCKLLVFHVFSVRCELSSILVHYKPLGTANWVHGQGG